MSQETPSPSWAEQEETQFMDHYSDIPGPAQHVIIVILFLAILAGIVILRDMLKTSGKNQG